jgi:hypothetical protein
MDAREDHLAAVLLRGVTDGSGDAEADYDSLAQLSREPGETSERTLLAVTHEAMHAGLNATTAFGVFLSAYAVLAHDSPSYSKGLQSLVEKCRRVHEAYATYESVWLVTSGDAKVLAPYPSYELSYREASSLVSLPDSSLAKKLMIEAAVRASMQPKGVESLLEHNLPLEPSRWLRARDEPDGRFSILRYKADDAFWTAAWSRCAAAVDAPGWRKLAAKEEGDPTRVIGDDEDGEIAETVGRLLYEEVSKLLARHNVATLEYDEHRIIGERVIANLEKKTPQANRNLRLADDSTAVAPFNTFAPFGQRGASDREQQGANRTRQ